MDEFLLVELTTSIVFSILPAYVGVIKLPSILQVVPGGLMVGYTFILYHHFYIIIYFYSLLFLILGYNTYVIFVPSLAFQKAEKSEKFKTFENYMYFPLKRKFI